MQNQVERQNVLNNRFAIKEAEKQFNLKGIEMNGIVYYTRQQIADFLKLISEQ